MYKLLLISILTVIFHNVAGQSLFESEKVFIHTDRQVYAAGDTIFFDAFITDLNSGKYSKNSEVLYVTLAADERKLISSVNVKIREGRANSFLVVPASVSAGYYSFSSYTNYMRNHKDQFVFQKIIEVSKTRMHAVVPKTKAKEYVPSIKFFPEGGTLVSGISSKIGFKTNLPDSLKRHFEGKVLDETGAMVSSFFPDYAGSGSFFFEPERGKKYKTVLKIRKKEYPVDFLEISDLGYTITTDNVVYNEGIMVNLYNNRNDSENLRIIAHLNGNKVFDFTFVGSNSMYKFPLADGLFDKSGLVEIALFNAVDAKLCSRIVYYDKADNVKTTLITKNTPLGAITSDLGFKKIDNSPLENILLSVSASEYAGKATINEREVDFINYLKFYSELNSEIPLVDSLFKLKPTVSKYYIDNLMISQKQNRAYSLTKIEDKYKVEKALNMKAVVFSDSAAVRNSNVNIFTSDDFGYLFFKTKTNDSGEFNLVGDWSDTLKIFAKDNAGKNLDIKFVYPYVPEYHGEEKLFVLKGDYSLNDKSIKLGELVVQNKNLFDPKTDPRRKLYGYQAERSFIPDSTINSLSLETFLEQKVEEILDGELSNESFELLFKNQMIGVNNKSTNMMFLIDGRRVPVSFLKLFTTKDIEQVDVFKDAKTIKLFNAEECVVINVLSKSGKSMRAVFSQDNVQSWVGFTTAKPFNNLGKTLPQPINLKKKKNTVFWKPNFEVNTNTIGKLKFNKSDALKRYQIQVYGLTESGDVVSERVLSK